MKKVLSVFLALLMAFTLIPVSFVTANAEEHDDNDCITFTSDTSFTLKSVYESKTWDGTLYYSTDKSDWTPWTGFEITAAQINGTGAYCLSLYGTADNTKISNAYQWVFDGTDIACTGNIETLRGAVGDAPSLTQPADRCYFGMFYDCVALTTTPELPATQLSASCYQYMFFGCTGLTAVPTLPATQLADSCYEGMFYGCTGIRIGANDESRGTWDGIPAEATGGENPFVEMFKGTGGSFKKEPVPGTAYYYEHRDNDCITFTSDTSFTLKSVYESKSWDGTLFYSTDKSDWTPWTGFEITAAQINGTGAYCLSLYGMADNTKISNAYQWVFDGTDIACTGNIETLRGAVGDAPSPTQPADRCYFGMFYDCVALTTTPELPATKLSASCYQYMFFGCTGLTAVPTLPATQLADSCYEGMFYGCTGIRIGTDDASLGAWNGIPADATGGTNPFVEMFKGTGGSFKKEPVPGTTYYYEPEPHVHSFAYSADGAVLTATCSATGCELADNKESVSLSAPALTVYGANESADATLSAYTLGDLTISNTDIKYYKKSNGVYGDALETAPTAAGDYKVTVTVDTDKTAFVEYTVSPLKLTIAEPAVTTEKTYDGTVTAAVTAGVLTNKIATDTVTVSATANYDTKDAGTGKTITVNYIIAGADAANYTAPDVKTITTGVVNAKQLTVTGTAASGKPFDGNVYTTATIGTVNGIETDDTVSVEVDTALFDDANAGEDKTVTVTYKMSGVDAGNYIKPVNDTPKATITPATPVISAVPTASAVTYGQTLSDSTLNGGEADVTGTFTWKDNAVVPTVSDSNVTEYDVIFTPDDANYGKTECKVRLAVGKAIPDYAAMLPVLRVIEGWTLADIELPEGFTWEEDEMTSVGAIGANTFHLKYTPADTDNYEVVENIEITVSVGEKRTLVEQLLIFFKGVIMLFAFFTMPYLTF